MIRVTRQARSRQTQRRLVRAADNQFSRRGFHAASLDGIARTANVTTGAVYSAFKGKADLFLEAYDAYLDERLAEIASVVDTTHGSQSTEIAARQFFAKTDRNRGWHMAWFEFRLHAARSESLNRQVAERNERLLDGIAAHYRAALEATRAPDPAGSALLIARSFVALANGYALEHWTDPSVSVEHLTKASRALVGGLWAGAGGAA